MKSFDQIDTVAFNEAQTAVVIIDQTKLPGHLAQKTLTNLQQLFDAIRNLEVRGAPAIGVAAACGLALASQKSTADNYGEFYKEFQQNKSFLAAARPTAVNLFWALDRLEQVVLANATATIAALKTKLLAEAQAIHAEDIRICRAIGCHGLTLLQDGWHILTHCNAGRLATSRYGTALAPLYVGQEQGYTFHVYADETRPLLQGARLTAFELQQSGIETTLLCDNMAASLLAQGNIQAILVGADRIAANGDTANKIGTCGLAVLAQHYNVPFYVCAPRSTFDPNTPNGAAIPIEQRAAAEVTSLWYQKPLAPAGIAVYNPAFDVTPAELISAIVTEEGILQPPFAQTIPAFFAKQPVAPIAPRPTSCPKQDPAQAGV